MGFDKSYDDVTPAVEEVLAAEAQEEENKALLEAVNELLKEEDKEEQNFNNKQGNRQLRRKRSSFYGLRERVREKLREKVVQPVAKKVVQPVAQASVRATRRIVTGNTQVRIRDFVVLPKVVRVLDKFIFTGGVMGMLLTEFVMLQYPEWFGYYNILMMLPLLLLRVVLFYRTKQHYFLLDYCYWVNGLGMSLCLLPASNELRERLFEIFFISANGPLFFAMVAWNNSLVFHSVDKVTSVYVHLFPALTCWCERWYSSSGTERESLTLSQHLGWPLVFYLAWQIVYLLQTEWWYKDTLDADADLSTSLRYITSAEKMSIHQQTLKLCRRLRILGPEETFTPPTLKVKIIFVVVQMLMTICTFVPAGWLFQSKISHTFVILAILLYSVYNGARYYIQVFSKIHDKRYFDNNDDDREEYVDTSAVMTEHIDASKKSK
mmetsp:Transcript_14460/g.21304  ORF Transcript_14460/g.21304 Transcript_14460/m.21304 type:complete len:435 (+) Transcript_14460:85-1389(+)